MGFWPKCLVFIIAGIVSTEFIADDLQLRQVLLPVQCCLGLIALLLRQRILISSLLIYLGISILAFSICQNLKNQKFKLLESRGNASFIKNAKFKIHATKNRSSSILAEAEIIGQNTSSRSITKVLLNIKCPPDSVQPLDILHCNAYMRLIPPARNDEAFDKKSWYNRKNIYYECFIEKDFRVERNYKIPDSPKLKAIYFREILSDRLEQALINPVAYQISAAMILGERSGLESETRETFKNSGTMHVLAVSGMHLGIVYLIINLALRFLKIYRIKALCFVIHLCFILSYLMVTGASASVTRAGIMLAIYLFYKAINRPTSIYNILCISAIIILLNDPFRLYDLGFQFSYLALFGILFFYPVLEHLITFENKILRYVIKMIFISIAAQIPLTPLMIYYFNCYPVYFWLSGIIAVPLAGLILFTGLLSLLLSSIGIIPEIISNTAFLILEYVSCILFYLLGIINKFPFAVITDIHLPAPSLVLSYVSILFFCFYITQRRSRLLYISLGFIVASLLSIIIQKSRALKQRQFDIYYVYDKSCISFTHGGECKILYTDINDEHFDYIRYKNKLVFHAAGLTHLEHESVWKQNQLLNCYGTKILIFPDSNIPDSITARQIDLAILNESGYNLLLHDKIGINADCFILDGSLDFKYREKIKSWLSQNNYNYHDCYEMGKYSYKI